MGYNTNYDIEIIGAIEVQEVDLIADIIDAVGYNPFEDKCCWYEHKIVMDDISALHPELIFKLHGEGEDSGDIWNKYFKAGKMQECRGRVVYDEFDESKLQ